VTLGCILIFDPDRVNANGNDNTDQGVRVDDCIDTVVRRDDCIDTVVRRTIVGYIYGEGLDVGKGNVRAIVEDCTFINCRHVMLYGMWSTDTIFRRNLLASTRTRIRRGTRSRTGCRFTTTSSST